MSANTRIEWADHTFNCWEGCQKVGPGCDNCYAEARNARFAGGASINWGPGAPRRRTSEANWKLPLRWNAAHDAFAAIHGRRQRVFCASLADVFDNEVDPAWREDLFVLIADTPHLDWLLLTKRIGNVKTMCPPGDWKADVLARQVRLGITVVNQPEANRDIRKLLATPAYRHFLSLEPLLGPVDITAREVIGEDGVPAPGGGQLGTRDAAYPRPPRIDEVFVGGESGPDARPTHPAWVRSLRDQCANAAIPFLFKQWGEWREIDSEPGADLESEIRRDRVRIVSASGERGGEFQPGDVLMRRVGKAAAGRLLDGVEHNAFDAEPLLLEETKS